MKPSDFSINLTKFLSSYLPLQRNVSKNTISSYCDAFSLFLKYCRDCKNIKIEKLCLCDINSALITGFLLWLKEERGNSNSTINQRLAAIHSFFRYVQTEAPQNMLTYQKILAIPYQKKDKPSIGYLSYEDLKLILRQPDINTQAGRRDLAILSLLYDSGARVQELVDLKVRDIRLESPCSVRLTGKGRKTRELPLMDNISALLSEYLHENNLYNHYNYDYPLFVNRQGNKFTRAGITYILKKYSAIAKKEKPSLNDDITPHLFRHTKAMHLLQAGVNLVYIRDILGHVNINTTEIYARADTEMKRKALAKTAPLPLSESAPSWVKNENLLKWLKEFGSSVR